MHFHLHIGMQGMQNIGLGVQTLLDDARDGQLHNRKGLPFGNDPPMSEYWN